MSDPRVKAGMSYDGARLPPPGDTQCRLAAAFCFLYSDTVKAGARALRTDGMNDALVVDGPPGSCSVLVRGATHVSFSDMSHWPVMARAVGGAEVRLDPTEMTELLNAMTLGFFDHHLKGAPLAGLTPSATLHIRWSPMRGQ